MADSITKVKKEEFDLKEDKDKALIMVLEEIRRELRTIAQKVK